MTIILDNPPQVILPDHYQHSRPAIIRPGVDLASYFPIEIDRNTRRAIIKELRSRGIADDKMKIRWLLDNADNKQVRASIPFGMFGAAPVITGIHVVNVATTDVTTGSTTPVVNLPDSLINGNLLVIMVCYGSSGTGTNTMTGFTDIWSDDANIRGFIGYRTIDGSEGATASGTLNSALRVSGVAFQVQNWTGTPDIATTTSGSVSDDFNPPSNTPSWGGTTTFLAIAGAFYRNPNRTPSAYPTNFDENQYNIRNGALGSTDGAMWCATDKVTGTSVDPSAVAVSGITARMNYTLLIRES